MRVCHEYALAIVSSLALDADIYYYNVVSYDYSHPKRLGADSDFI